MPAPYTFDPNLPLLAQAFFYFLLFLFSLYGVFLAYHWFTYGTSKHTSTVALATYLMGGAVLFLTLASAIGLVE